MLITTEEPFIQSTKIASLPMRKYLFILISCLCLEGGSVLAQVPGYQGKRFFLEFGGTFFFNGASPNAQNKGPASFPFGKHTGDFTLVDRYRVGAHYVIARKSTLKLDYNYHLMGLNTSATTPNVFQTSQLDNHNLFYQVHLHDFNLGLTLYRRRNANLAPLGFYWDLGIRLIFTAPYLRDQRVEYADNRPDNRPNPRQLNPIEPAESLVLFGFAAQTGYRTVFADRFIFNIGLETTLFPFVPTGLNGGPPPPSSYQDDLQAAVQLRYLLGVYIGVGILLF